jgi:hypothetical protein
VVAGVCLVAVGGMQEETSSPHVRLECFHLQEPPHDKIIGTKNQSNSTALTIKKKNTKNQRRANAR